MYYYGGGSSCCPNQTSYYYPVYTGNNNSNYAIIEMNYNPAIHIHTYPLIGKGRPVAQSILKALNFIS